MKLWSSTHNPTKLTPKKAFVTEPQQDCTYHWPSTNTKTLGQRTLKSLGNPESGGQKPAEAHTGVFGCKTHELNSLDNNAAQLSWIIRGCR